MKKNQFIILPLLILIIAVFIFLNKQKDSQVVPQGQDQNISQPPQSDLQPNNSTSPSNQNLQVENDFRSPLDRPQERVTKKYFGIFITPKTSPVQPEKFYGYHTGADFETFPDEADIDVPIHAVCSGKLLNKRYASGYGGVAVQSCSLNNQPITVVYGHLNLSSISAKSGDNLNTRDLVGNLGKGYSAETDGERKHLHLGFHKGNSINILGYVQNKSQLSQWLDPCQFVCGK